MLLHRRVPLGEKQLPIIVKCEQEDKEYSFHRLYLARSLFWDYIFPTLYLLNGLSFMKRGIFLHSLFLRSFLSKKQLNSSLVITICFENLPMHEITECGNSSLMWATEKPEVNGTFAHFSLVQVLGEAHWPHFFRRTWTWITALYHVPWAAGVSHGAWTTPRRRTMKTVGTAPEGEEASPVGFLTKSFKCKYKGIAIQRGSDPPPLSHYYQMH